MPGRHSQQPRSRSGRVAMLAGGVGLVLALGAGLVWATSVRDEPAPKRATTVADRSDSGAAGPTDATATVDPNTPPTALVGCARSLESGNAVVEAAVPARDHWAGHVQAQLDHDAKKISGKQMVDIFAATKAAGPADLAAYDAARAGYQPAADTCGGLDAAGLAPRWAELAGRCSQRAGALATAVQAGDAVVADWRAHVQMMADRPHTDRVAYGKMWRSMVTAAPTHLNGFTAARDELGRQPSCSVTAS